ncbi:MAG: DUF2851 family protein [Verrucomicrobia bacterium]|nr:DUF2851 family protein [Verrucomicrobiota bacterium]
MSLSSIYTALLWPRLEEPEPRESPGELELQARWFAGEFGTEFRTTDGRRVEIAQFGVWNRGAGPDFLDAAVSFDGRNAQRGAIELDLDPADWEVHGHGANPDFEQVVLHLYVHERAGRENFTRTALHRLVPRVRIDPRALVDLPPATPPLARLGRCSAPLRELGDARALTVLTAAARHRLERKSARFQRLTEAHGRDEALWQMLASALGYRENALPLHLLAQRLPLRLLRARRADASALLFGLAGFVHGDEFGADETRAYLRQLWERWWPWRGEWTRLVLPRGSWRLRATRPANHPQRRVAALAALAAEWPKVTALAEAPRLARATHRLARELRDEFWEHHFTLRSARQERRIALLGPARVREILANVLYPALLPERPELWEEYLALPAVLTNRRAETAAARLFGGTTVLRARLPRTVAVQQGLLQVYEDFCLRDATDCARCQFPERVRRFGER